jgi:hypothetical protein
MSQHYFKTSYQGQAITVLMGWDRPLQGHFLVVEKDDVKEDAFVYSNLLDPALNGYRGLPPSLEYFKTKLSELGLTVPERMIREIEADRSANVGNRHVWYDELGNVGKQI